MENTNQDFYTKQNIYNASPITLAEQIYKACSNEGEFAVFLYSGQRVPKKEFPLLDELIGRHLTLNHSPTQNDILLFLGKNASCMTDPAIVLTIIKLPSALKNIQHFWMLTLCRYCKAGIGLINMPLL